MMSLALGGLMLGIAGSMHCVGMCGPLVMALPAADESVGKRLVNRATYTIARITVYAAMGAIVGLGASVFDLSGYGRVLSVVAGVSMIAIALAQLLWHKSLLPTRWLQRHTAPLRAAAIRQAQRHPKRAMVFLGVVNGLLPCGLVTSALIGSALGGGVAQGVVFMAGFGVGTSPALLAIAFGASALRQRLGARLGIIIPLLAFTMGVLIVLRGMELGIPYLSPPSIVAHQHTSCCNGQ